MITRRLFGRLFQTRLRPEQITLPASSNGLRQYVETLEFVNLPPGRPHRWSLQRNPEPGTVIMIMVRSSRLGFDFSDAQVAQPAEANTPYYIDIVTPSVAITGLDLMKAVYWAR